MATHIKILNNKDIETFNSPPEFNGEERKRFLSALKKKGEHHETSERLS